MNLQKLFKYFINIVIAINQLINTIFGGYPDEAISSRSHRLHRDNVTGIPRKIVNNIFFWQKDHCKSAYESELKRNHMSSEFWLKEVQKNTNK